MFPSSISGDQSNVAAHNSKSFGQLDRISSSFSSSRAFVIMGLNIFRLPFSNFMTRVLRAFKFSPLRVSVCDIFNSGSNPVVIGVATSSIVPSGAIMQNAHSFRHRTSTQNPRGYMRPYLIVWPIRPLNHSISVAFSSLPQPAIIRPALAHLAPKSRWKRLRKSLRSQILSSYLNHGISYWPVRLTGAGGPFQ